MTDARFPERWLNDRRVLRLPDDAFRLFVLSLAWSVANQADGRIYDLTPGTLFDIPAEPHDSWVVGDEPYVSLHFLGADAYAK